MKVGYQKEKVMPKGPTVNDANINIRVPNQLMDALRQQADKESIKTSALIRDVLVTYLISNNHSLRDLMPPREVDHQEVDTVIQKDINHNSGEFLE